MYHVIDTGLTTLFLYLISYFFYRIGYYSVHFYRRVWNTLLAIAFITAAIAGLFMALQINYKWNIPFIKSVLKWHVEFGIGLAFTGLFHLLWHLSYFGKFFHKSDKSPDNIDYQKSSFSDFGTNLFIIGFVSTSIQLLLIREVMNITGGYELIVGTFLGSWLIGSSVGASFAGKSILNDIRKINLVFSLSPVISLLLLICFSRLFLNSGETPSFLISIIYTFIVLIPFCLSSGFTFVKLIQIAQSGKGFVPGKSFSIETIGGIVSGILISVLTAGLLNTYQIILLVITLSVAYVFVTFYIRSIILKTFTKIFIGLIASVIIISKPDVLFRQILHTGIKVTDSKDTPYGNITRGSYKGEESMFYNQRLLSYKNDVIQREEDIHYAMLQSEYPEKVILISGSLNSNIPELLKYHVKKIIYIERDPALAKSEISAKDSVPVELVIENADAFRYIRNTKEMADVIILLLPPPSTLLLNKYYTTEFFLEVKKRLNSNGIFLCSPGPGDDYFNKESLNLYSSIFNSLATVFRNVKPVVGNKLYFIAADKEIKLSFCNLAEMRGIKNIYVSSDFLSDDLIANKSDEITSRMDHGIKQNRFAFPVASFHFQSYNFSKNIDEKIPAIILMLVVFALPILIIKRRNMVMCLSASALAGFEIIMLLTLQLIIGNMFQLTGLIIAGLMAGLAIGAGVNITFLNSFSLRKKVLFLMLFYIGIGLIYNNLLEVRAVLTAVSIILFLVFLPALYTGHIFRELTLRTEGMMTTSATYSADLAGSAFGFILISGFTVPAFGIQISIFLLSGLVLTGFLFGAVKNKL